MLTLYKSSWTLTFPFRETGATPEPRYQIRIILSHAPFFGYINMTFIGLLLNFKMLFDDFNIVFDDYADICDICDLRESQDQSNDQYIFNTPKPKQEMLSPPISMPSSSKSYDTVPKNDSDLRESNFLRRMNQSKTSNESQTKITIEINSLIISKPVQSEDFQLSKVKLKLDKQPKFDQSFMKRATNRRSIKNQKRDDTDSYNRITRPKSETNIKYTETCEVW